MSAFGQIDQGVHKEIFDLLNEESVSGVRSGRTNSLLQVFEKVS